MKKVILIAILITLAASGPAHAWKLELTPRFYVSEEYNDNIYLTNDDEEEDFITGAGVGFTLETAGKHNTLTLDYDPKYQYFSQNDDLSFWEQKASLAWEWQLARHTNFKIQDRFTYTEDPFFVTDVIITEFKGIKKFDFTVRKDRRAYTSNTASATLTHETQGKNTVELDYLYSILKNDDEEIEDNERHSPSMEINYKMSPHNALTFLAGYTLGDFEESEDFDRIEGNLKWTRNFAPHWEGYLEYDHTYLDYDRDKTGYNVYNPMMGIVTTLGKQTELTLAGGYFYQDKGAGGDESGPAGELELEHRFERGTASVFGSYGSDESYFGTENLGLSLSYDAGLRFSYQLFQDFAVELSGRYRRDEYKDLEEPRIDDTYRGGCSLIYNPTSLRWLFVNLSYLYYSLDSTDDEKIYANNRVILQFTLIPKQPWKW